MINNKRLNNYDDLLLVLDVTNIPRIMGIFRVAPMSWFTHSDFRRSEVTV